MPTAAARPARAAIFAAVSALAVISGGAAPARAYPEAPFCAENYSRAGFGKQCRFYTYEQCTAFTSGIGGSCSANPWYQYEPAPRGRRGRRHLRG